MSEVPLCRRVKKLIDEEPERLMEVSKLLAALLKYQPPNPQP
jgi:hypothetical protein